MSMSDPIGDMLSSIKNAITMKHNEVVISHSKMKESIVKLLLQEGFIKDYNVNEENKKKSLVIILKYTEDGEPVIRGLKRVSLPSRRRYIKPKDMPLVLGGLGTGIISTSKGLKTVKECKHLHIGGEYICQLW
ncbi:MAG: 30S ribosomal protein S8 [Deferribacterota bacterium]|nr:30S ribosomal protein S8 [Deferribacterota bacterium]